MIGIDVNIFYSVEVGFYQETASCSNSYSGHFSYFSSAYEQSAFCDMFHAKESGWRGCTSCGKVECVNHFPLPTTLVF